MPGTAPGSAKLESADYWVVTLNEQKWISFVLLSAEVEDLAH